MGSCEDVIDLTNSFMLIEHSSLTNEIIVLDTDESFNTSPKLRPKPSQRKTKSSIEKKSKSLTNKSKSGGTYKFGSCPICWEELGKNPLASTKCGHVFCFKCLEKSLQQLGKTCPSCRTALKGSSAYHPLYFNPF